jgi:hypothetical protein
MFIKNLSLAAAATAVMSIAAQVQASPAPSTQCAASETYSALAVAPYSVRQDTGYDSYNVLQGVQLYVPAKQGLTAEWLNLNIQSHLAKPDACRPNVRDVKVSVVPAGAGFWVYLSAPDERSAATLLQWVRGVVTATGSQPMAAK